MFPFMVKALWDELFLIANQIYSVEKSISRLNSLNVGNIGALPALLTPSFRFEQGKEGWRMLAKSDN